MEPLEAKKQLEEILKDHGKDEAIIKAIVEAAKPHVDAEAEFLAYLGSDKGKKFLQAENDKHFEKALETWKENNLDKTYTERYNKEHPPEDEKDKRLRALEQENATGKEERTRLQLKGDLTTYAKTIGMSETFVPRAMGETLEISKANLDEMKTEIEAVTQKAVADKVTTRTPPNGNPPEGLFTKAEIEAMSQEDIIKNKQKIMESMTAINGQEWTQV